MSYLDAPKRLGKLTRGVLKRDVNHVLDELVRKAAGIAQTPMAVVSLVLENLQVFRATVGLSVDEQKLCATPRCDSFCQYVVEGRSPFVVEDALTDGRIPADVYALVGVRGYCGIPVFVGGEVVGALCVFDTEPRTFTSVTTDRLKALAELASQELERESHDSQDASRAAHEEFEGRVAEDALPTCHPELRPIISAYLDTLPQGARSFALARLMLKTRFAHTLHAKNVPELQSTMRSEIARLRDG